MIVSAEIWQANRRRHCAREPTPKPSLVSLLYSAAGAVLDGAHSSLVAATAQLARKRAHEFRFESRVQTGTRAAVLFLSLAAATGAVAQEPNQSRETPDSASADLGSGEGSEAYGTQPSWRRGIGRGRGEAQRERAYLPNRQQRPARVDRPHGDNCDRAPSISRSSTATSEENSDSRPSARWRRRRYLFRKFTVSSDGHTRQA